MTSSDSMLPAEARRGSPFAAAPASRWDWIDGKLSWLSEYLNPILVKETRQALKSRQFLITFSLLLIAGWGSSLLIVAFNYPSIYYAPLGSVVLAVYFCILCVPMLLIIPFVAFRSLSGEREDGTFDLVSITTMRPRQIVGGKLGSAIVQMLLYLSALAPAMTFTYLLRGIDLLVILLSIAYLILASLALSVLGLLLATVTTSRGWQTVLGVIFIIMLLVVTIIAVWSGIGMIAFTRVIEYDQPFFWPVQLFVVSVLAAYTALLYLAAMARVTFPSDNRSTRIRICLFGMQAVAVGWATWFWLAIAEDGVFLVLIWWTGIHWSLMGALLVGESSEISPRVRRQLPATFMGRAFSIWLFPGPGAGFALMTTCVASLLALVLAAALGADGVGRFIQFAGQLQASLLARVVLLAVVLLLCVGGAALVYRMRHQPTAVALAASSLFALLAGCSIVFLIAIQVPPSMKLGEEVALSAVFIFCYLVNYIGLTRLVMMLCERFVQGGVFLSALWSILLVLVGSFVPFVLQNIVVAMMSRRYIDYTALQAPNPIWTLSVLYGGGLTQINYFGVQTQLETVLLVASAGAMLLVNLLLAAREVERQREAAPQRVLEEERQLHPAKTADAGPSSPWDDKADGQDNVDASAAVE